MEDALARLEGVKVAKSDQARGLYLVEVLESKVILPSALKKVAANEGRAYLGCTIEAAGTVEKAGEGWVFVARGSGQRYDLTPNDEFKKMVAGGKTKLLISGGVTEPEEKDGKRPLPVIEVSGVKELAEEGKK